MDNWRVLRKWDDHFLQYVYNGGEERGSRQRKTKREGIKERMACKPVRIDRSPWENQRISGESFPPSAAVGRGRGEERCAEAGMHLSLSISSSATLVSVLIIAHHHRRRFTFLLITALPSHQPPFENAEEF
ncbi:hypothetical protein F2P81_003256 [Scophthalmus maximus]|uniref:Uncharacterized protein n=1 Tax=Scophthalmus maximus TaxID=52904 RepID=A0A6A4THY9_SCOMX|nr:hypothetical protein F2P81_003256 [Scophthalmus maximus]